MGRGDEVELNLLTMVTREKRKQGFGMVCDTGQEFPSQSIQGASRPGKEMGGLAAI